jgi:hypothetical protein
MTPNNSSTTPQLAGARDFRSIQYFGSLSKAPIIGLTMMVIGLGLLAGCGGTTPVPPTASPTLAPSITPAPTDTPSPPPTVTVTFTPTPGLVDYGPMVESVEDYLRYTADRFGYAGSCPGGVSYV